MSKVKKRGDIPLDNPIEVDVIHCADPNSSDQALEGGDGVPYFDSDGDASSGEYSDGVVTRSAGSQYLIVLLRLPSSVLTCALKEGMN